jgi:hypothetical protein
MSDKKQTAVQWLLEQWPILESQLPSYIINQALEMERQQIVDAWNDGDYAYFYDIDGKEFEDGDEYYEEKFGGQDEN